MTISTPISASLVKALRDKTDAPIVDCKKALIEAGGDLTKAKEVLRVRLGQNALRVSARPTTEGVIAARVSTDGKAAVILEVTCETDFVARDEIFTTFAQNICQIVLEHQPAHCDALSVLRYNQQETVEQARVRLVGTMGENIAIARFVCLQTALHTFQHYVHNGRIGAIVEYDGPDSLGKDLALHIVASRPVCVSRDQVPEALVAKERAIFLQQAQESGKPAHVVTKMVEGRVTKFLSEITLCEQAFVKNTEHTVQHLLEVCQGHVARFVIFSVGEHQ